MSDFQTVPNTHTISTCILPIVDVQLSHGRILYKLNGSLPVFAYIGIALLVLLAALLVFIGTRPANFQIQRSARVNAPREVVFAIINDMHQWGRWSPWEKLDSNMKKSHEGPPSGPGSIYSWNGNSKVGEGRMTILDTRPNELIAMRLEFFRPFKCNNQVFFELAPADGGTQVNWIMKGQNNFISKAMSLVMNMDKMVGKDFENGLANLDTVAQEEVKKSKAS